MGLREALKTLSQLKEKGVIKDYAIGGAHAVAAYIEPPSTRDLDILILLKDDSDLSALYRYFRTLGNEIKGLYIVIDEMPVHFLPSYISPIYSAAIENANIIEDLSYKVVSEEYLIALLLIAYRPKDKIHIKQLLPLVDIQILDEIVERFGDDENLLRQRFKEILA